MSVLISFAVPVFLMLLALEAWKSSGRTDIRGYELRDTATSLAMGVGNVLIAAATKGTTFLINLELHEFAPVQLGDAWWVWLLLIPAEDFCYYWFHRCHHEVRALWAAHVNHHSSTHYNLSTALRQSWTTPLTGPVFWMPLPLLGFDPHMILTAQAISLIYQFWLHTEWIKDLGAFERVFNTPSHHRVHHGRNVQYLDRNYAGIFIVWDRLFGSFEPERQPVDYGLTSNIETFALPRVAFHEWAAMLRAAGSASNWRDSLRYLTYPPGWSPDGSTRTARQMQAEGQQTAD